VHDLLHVIDFEPLQVQADLKYEEKLVQILDQSTTTEDNENTTSKSSIAEP
jgi:hypothetical protein